MKFGYYIVYGDLKPVDNPDERKKPIEKFGKVIEKNGGNKRSGALHLGQHTHE